MATGFKQVKRGEVLMQFAATKGKWIALWHSNIADYDAIRRIIGRHDQPEPMIAELEATGFQVTAEILEPNEDEGRTN